MNDINDLTREIFIVYENAQAGPYTEDDIATMYDSGSIDENTLCWELGNEEWIPLRQLSGFEHIKKQTPLISSQETGPAGGLMFSSLLKAVSVALVFIGLFLATFYINQSGSATADDEAKDGGYTDNPELNRISTPLRPQESQQNAEHPLAYEALKLLHYQRDPARAKALFKVLEKSQDPVDIYVSALLLKDGFGVAGDVERANQLFNDCATEIRSLAQRHDAFAQYCLGSMHFEGLGVPKNSKLAKEYYQEAATAGNAEAIYRLGWTYTNGHRTSLNYDRAREYYEKAADAGELQALVSLGGLYSDGKGVSTDYPRAVGYYEKAATAGNSWGNYNLGWMYENGEGVPKDGERAVGYYQSAAKMGNLSAMVKLGSIYSEGNSAAKDLAKAKAYFEQGAEFGSSRAFFWLGRIYIDGLGVPEGDDRMMVYVELGKLYGEGPRIPEDFIRARDFFEQASKGGDSLAMNELGLIYLYGVGTKIDHQRARRYFELAAEDELPDSLLGLAMIYTFGLGVPMNKESGFKYVEKAAEAGSPKAREMLRESGRGERATARASSPSSSTGSDTGVTCAEWLARASKIYKQFDYINENNDMPLDSKDAVFKNLGKPTKEVHTGGSLVLVYRCTDGTIAIEVNLGAWNSTYQMVLTKQIVVEYH